MPRAMETGWTTSRPGGSFNTVVRSHKKKPVAWPDGFAPKTGDKVDVYSQGDDTWYASVVLGVSPTGLLRIHFDLWHSKHDFDVPRARTTEWVAPLHTHTEPMVPEEGCTFVSEFSCAICGEGGDIICCDDCPKVFHLECIKLKATPHASFRCGYCGFRDEEQRKREAAGSDGLTIGAAASSPAHTAAAASSPAAAAASSYSAASSPPPSSAPAAAAAAQPAFDEHKAQRRPAEDEHKSERRPPVPDTSSDESMARRLAAQYEEVGDLDSEDMSDGSDEPILLPRHAMATRPSKRVRRSLAEDAPASRLRLRNSISYASSPEPELVSSSSPPLSDDLMDLSAMPTDDHAACRVCGLDGLDMSVCACCSRASHAMCDETLSSTDDGTPRLCYDCIRAKIQAADESPPPAAATAPASKSFAKRSPQKRVAEAEPVSTAGGGRGGRGGKRGGKRGGLTHGAAPSAAAHSSTSASASRTEERPSKPPPLPKLRGDNVAALAIFLRHVHWQLVHEIVAEPSPEPGYVALLSGVSISATAAAASSSSAVQPKRRMPLPRYLERDYCRCEHMFDIRRVYPENPLTAAEIQRVLVMLRQMRDEHANLVYNLQNAVEHLDAQWHEDVTSYFTQLYQAQALLTEAQNKAKHVEVAERKKDLTELENEYKRVEKDFSLTFFQPFRRFADVDRIYQILVDALDYLESVPVASKTGAQHRQLEAWWIEVSNLQRHQSQMDGVEAEELARDAATTAPLEPPAPEDKLPTPTVFTFRCYRCAERFSSMQVLQDHIADMHLKQLDEVIAQVTAAAPNVPAPAPAAAASPTPSNLLGKRKAAAFSPSPSPWPSSSSGSASASPPAAGSGQALLAQWEPLSDPSVFECVRRLLQVPGAAAEFDAILPALIQQYKDQTPKRSEPSPPPPPPAAKKPKLSKLAPLPPPPAYQPPDAIASEPTNPFLVQPSIFPAQSQVATSSSINVAMFAPTVSAPVVASLMRPPIYSAAVSSIQHDQARFLAQQVALQEQALVAGGLFTAKLIQESQVLLQQSQHAAAIPARALAPAPAAAPRPTLGPSAPLVVNIAPVFKVIKSKPSKSSAWQTQMASLSTVQRAIASSADAPPPIPSLSASPPPELIPFPAAFAPAIAVAVVLASAAAPAPAPAAAAATTAATAVTLAPVSSVDFDLVDGGFPASSSSDPDVAAFQAMLQSLSDPERRWNKEDRKEFFRMREKAVEKIYW